jgi:hypothetical protein
MSDAEAWPGILPSSSFSVGNFQHEGAPTISMLSDHLFQQVRKATRQKGVGYFVRHRVLILDGSPSEVKASVKGRNDYDVSLVYTDGVIKMSCNCPFFQSTLDPCKHVWATILAAERKGFLSAAAGRSDIRFRLADDARQQPRPGASANGVHAARPQYLTSWMKILQQVARAAEEETLYAQANAKKIAWNGDRELVYVVDLTGTVAHNHLIIETPSRERKKDGGWSKPRMQPLRPEDLPHVRNLADMQIASLLMNCRDRQGSTFAERTLSRKAVPAELCDTLIPAMCATDRCFLSRSGTNYDDLEPVHWDKGPSWRFVLEGKRAPDRDELSLFGMLQRGEQRLPLSAAQFVLPSGVAMINNGFTHVDCGGAYEWVRTLRSQPEVLVPLSERDAFLQELFRLPRLPFVHLPPEFEVTDKTAAPQHKLIVRPNRYRYAVPRLEGELVHVYDGREVKETDKGGVFYSPQERVVIRRDRVLESAARERLVELGMQMQSSYFTNNWEFPASRLHKILRELVPQGWLVEAEGKVYRTAGAVKIDVHTGIDWFELTGRVEFEGQSIPLPKLLQAVRKGDGIIQLGDGSYGMLPDDWLKKYGLFAAVGTVDGDQIRFAKSQVCMLDALLDAQPNVQVDEAYRKARERMQSFQGVRDADPPKGFQGELRGYQRQGLGWLLFLQEFGWGGCLADDMGLGKTVQVLALLGQRARARDKDAPRASLVVVPRSLIFNWKAEAQRFTPWLKVLDHTGADRSKKPGAFKDFDLVLTTYGILRRDALFFKDCRFDYCILDESQAVKNASTEQAKAVRLLKGKHRIAMSGTPVENHLGELFSLFEFLNPGMLGHSSLFRASGAAARNPDAPTRALLAKALRPFILRRTKDQVAKDLPEKTEQTVFCELEPGQRKLYNELREYYRASLLSKIESDGMGKAKIMVLEALMRLRQAACHPGLIDKKKSKDSSAKLDILLPRLEEVFEEGHKAIVFSQFTSLLDIVKQRLDADKFPYEYLDGQTRDRQARVERFQNDPECKLFLISLKAGGVGLNLTAAEYVFLLDPWWNPAVEAQAIDRTHRIGQTRPVFAYRIIARDTVEEKVLELQKNKRDLADAILTADNSLIGNLKKEDLELLLS